MKRLRGEARRKMRRFYGKRVGKPDFIILAGKVEKIERFPIIKHFASYTGLVPSTYPPAPGWFMAA